MRGHTTRVARRLFCLVPAAVAFSPGQPMSLAPECRLWVDGTSTVRSWSCAATEIDATIEAGAPEAIEALGAPGPDATLRVTGSHEFAMTEFDVEPPTRMRGTMKVGNRVKVSVDLYLSN